MSEAREQEYSPFETLSTSFSELTGAAKRVLAQTSHPHALPHQRFFKEGPLRELQFYESGASEEQSPTMPFLEMTFSHPGAPESTYSKIQIIKISQPNKVRNSPLTAENTFTLSFFEKKADFVPLSTISLSPDTAADVSFLDAQRAFARCMQALETRPPQLKTSKQRVEPSEDSGGDALIKPVWDRLSAFFRRAALPEIAERPPSFPTLYRPWRGIQQLERQWLADSSPNKTGNQRRVFKGEEPSGIQSIEHNTRTNTLRLDFQNSKPLNLWPHRLSGSPALDQHRLTHLPYERVDLVQSGAWLKIHLYNEPHDQPFKQYNINLDGQYPDSQDIHKLEHHFGKIVLDAILERMRQR